MISLFLGLTIANMAVLSIVFSLGWLATDVASKPTRFYAIHIAMAIAAGMLVLLTHIGTYMYFMATSRWLEAASHKVNIPLSELAQPALQRKTRAMLIAITAILVTMLCMFAGAAGDPTVHPWWPSQVHLGMAALAWMTNLACAAGEFRLIRLQGNQMDQAIQRIEQASATTDAATSPAPPV